MKKATQLLSLAFLLSAGAIITACSSDDNGIDEALAKKTYYVSIDASKGSTVDASRATRALSFDGTTITATWSTKDKIYVKYSNTWLEGSLSPNANAVGARLTGTITTSDLGDLNSLTLLYPKISWSYDGQKGTLADIAKNYDYAMAKDVDVTVSGSTITGTKIVEFDNLQAIVQFTLKSGETFLSPSALTVTIKKYDSTGDYVVSLTSIPSTTYDTNGDGILYVAIPGFESKIVELSATVGGATYTYSTKTDITFENGNYYPVTVKMTKKP